LPTLYSAATAFVWPSLMEGFGLPPLEAMACGTPVLTSNTSSMPEVVGDAAIQVDPLDVDAIASAMIVLAQNQELREALRQKGVKRAAAFSWHTTAEKTMAVYKKTTG
jgi:glycosyltransferase involved in cell wall biosynthesis